MALHIPKDFLSEAIQDIDKKVKAAKEKANYRGIAVAVATEKEQTVRRALAQGIAVKQLNPLPNVSKDLPFARPVFFVDARASVWPNIHVWEAPDAKALLAAAASREFERCEPGCIRAREQRQLRSALESEMRS